VRGFFEPKWQLGERLMKEACRAERRV